MLSCAAAVLSGVFATGCATLDEGLYVGVVAVDMDGMLDPAFGENGISMLRIGGMELAPCGQLLRGGIGVDAQRQIVTAGCVNGDFVATVRTEGGTPSRRFGSDGVARGPAGAATALAVGRAADTTVTGFAAVGQTTPRETDRANEFRVAVYDLDGIDSSFGTTSGVITTRFPPNVGAAARGVFIDGGGRIVVGGSVVDGMLALARYLPTGAMDPSFAGDGRTVRPLPVNWDRSWVGGVAVDSLGRIVVGGHFSFSSLPTGSDRSFFVTRYAANGNPDGRFGRFGITETNVPTDASAEWAYDVEVLADNRPVLCGSQPANPFDVDSLVFLVRYDESGQLDPTLDGDGIVAFSWPGGRLSNCLALDILPANAMLVTGHGQRPLDTSVLLTRFRADGTIDTAYGTGGATEISADEICAAYDCEPANVIVMPGSIDTIVSRGVSYTSFFARVR